MKALKEGDKKFIEIAETVSWTETKSLKEASDFLKKLVEE